MGGSATGGAYPGLCPSWLYAPASQQRTEASLAALSEGPSAPGWDLVSCSASACTEQPAATYPSTWIPPSH